MTAQTEWGRASTNGPEAVIGGLVFVIGVELVMGRMPDARLALRAGRARGALFLLTLVMTLTIPLQWAIIGGAILSLLAYIGSSGSATPIQAYRKDEGGWLLESSIPGAIPHGGVVALAYTGPNFFAEVPAAVDALPLPESRQSAPGVVVLGVGRLDAMPSTLIKAMGKYQEKLAAARCGLVLTGASPRAIAELKQTGLTALIGADKVLPEDPHLGADLEAGLARGQVLLAELGAAPAGSPGAARP